MRVRLSNDAKLYAVIALAALGFLLGFCAVVYAHSDGGMRYPTECCHQMDCAPVLRSEVVPPPVRAGLWPSPQQQLPVLWVETKHGRAPVDHTLIPRESTDGRKHACIREGRVVCIFYPAGL